MSLFIREQFLLFYFTLHMFRLLKIKPRKPTDRGGDTEHVNDAELYWKSGTRVSAQMFDNFDIDIKDVVQYLEKAPTR